MNNFEKFSNNIKSSKECLNDLRKLINLEDRLFIDQISHYLSQMECELLSDDQNKLGNYQGLLGVINQKVKATVKNIIHLNNIKSLYFINGSKKLSIGSWNKLLDSIDVFGDVVSLLGFQGNCHFILNDDHIEFYGPIAKCSWDDESKLKSYICTRKLLKSSILLTYKCFENNSQTYLRLKLDLAHKENLIYLIDLKNFKFNLGMINQFSNYYIDHDDLNSLGEHSCIEITDNLTVRRYAKIPDDIKMEYSHSDFNKSIFYFPFLFRPLSLIIPGSGQLRPKSSYIRLSDTGSAGLNNENINSHDPTKSFYYFFDFFKLMAS